MFKLIKIFILVVLSMGVYLYKFNTPIFALSCPAASSQSTTVNQITNGCFNQGTMGSGQNCVYKYWPCNTNDGADCSAVDCEGAIISPECKAVGGVAQKLRVDGEVCQTVTVSPYTNFTLSNSMWAGNPGGNAQLGYQVGPSGNPQWVTATQSNWHDYSITGSTGDQTTMYVYLHDQVGPGHGISDTYYDGMVLDINDGSQCWSIGTPGSPIYTSHTYPASIQMKNTGGTAWMAPNFYLRSLVGNTWGSTGVSLSNGTILPGGTGIFNFNISTPSTPGVYAFNWIMTHGTADFGQSCASNITVTTPVSTPTNIPTPTRGPSPTKAPTPTKTPLPTPTPVNCGCPVGDICIAGVCKQDQVNASCHISSTPIVTGNFTSWVGMVSGGDSNKTFTWSSYVNNPGQDVRAGTTQVVSTDNSTNPPTYSSIWNVIYSTPGTATTNLTITDPPFTPLFTACAARSAAPTPPSNIDVNGDVHSNGP